MGAADDCICCIYVCVVSGRCVVLEYADVRLPNDHGCDAVHCVHIQPLRHQRGPVGAAHHGSFTFSFDLLVTDTVSATLELLQRERVENLYYCLQLCEQCFCNLHIIFF